MIELVFRNAVLEDLTQIVDTYNSTIEGRMVTADTSAVTVESKLNWFYSHHPEKRPLFVLELHKEYVGWLSFNSFYGRPAYDITAEISLYLNEKARGKGIGKEALGRAIKLAPQFGIVNLLGFIFGHNEKSLALFYSFGFEKWAYLPGVALMDETERDLVILGKKIK